jgi:hypothetical protein
MEGTHLGNEIEMRMMAWTDHAKVLIACQNARYIEALGYGYNRGVDQTNVAVGVLLYDVNRAHGVLRGHDFQSKRASNNILQYRYRDVNSQIVRDEIINLRQYGDGHNQNIVCCRDVLARLFVQRIVRVSQRIKNIRVYKCGHVTQVSRFAWL